MSKTVTLTIGERLATMRIFDAFKGSISDMAVILDDVKKVAITTEDWDKAGRTITKGVDGEGKPTESWKWNEDDQSTLKDIELGTESVSYILKTIKDRSDKGEVTLADVALLSIQKKLQ